MINVPYPGDQQYENRTASYWSVSAQLIPYCLVQPLSTGDVSKAVKTLVGDAACKDTKFTIRSGGHTTWAGSNNIDDGVTIDLGFMNITTLNSDTHIASIQPGSGWGQVYETLDPLGFTVASGRGGPPLVSLAFLLEVGYRSLPTIPSLLTLPGGNSFFSAQ